MIVQESEDCCVCYRKKEKVPVKGGQKGDGMAGDGG